MTFNFEPYVEFCRSGGRLAVGRPTAGGGRCSSVRIAIGVALFGSALFWSNYAVDLACGEPFIRTSRISSLVCAASFLGAAIALRLDLRASRSEQ